MSAQAALSDVQLLQKTVREALGEMSPPARVRALMATESGWDPRLWRRLSNELGLPGIAVDERYGGSELSERELAVVFEEAGRALLCAPLFAVAALAIPLLTAVGDEDACRRWLPSLCDGSRTATVVTTDRHGRHGPDHIEVTADGGRLHGRAGYVVDGATADVVLTPARTPAGLAVFAVDRGAPGVDVTPLVTLDQTRRQAHLTFSAAPATRVGQGGASDAVARMFAVSCAMLASEQVGVAQRCLDMTVAYTRSRIQFGRPVGSFQAVKQKLADMLIRVESARSAATAAAQAAAAGSPDTPWVASVAKAYCSEACMAVAAETIQLHGGIGFTWEHDAHLYFKRARASEEMLGTPRDHYDRVGEHLATV